MCKDAGIGMSRTVEHLGIEIRNQTIMWETKEGTRKSCAQRIGIIKKTKELGKACMRTGTNTVLRMEVVPGRVWRSQAQGMAPAHRSVAKAVGQCRGWHVQPRASGRKQFGRENGRTM